MRGSQEVALAPYLASPVPLTLSPEAGADIGSQGSAGARVTLGKSVWQSWKSWQQLWGPFPASESWAEVASWNDWLQVSAEEQP